MNLLKRTFGAFAVIFVGLFVTGCNESGGVRKPSNHSPDYSYPTYGYEPYVYEEGPNRDVYQYYDWGYKVYHYRNGELQWVDTFAY